MGLCWRSGRAAGRSQCRARGHNAAPLCQPCSQGRCHTRQAKHGHHSRAKLHSSSLGHAAPVLRVSGLRGDAGAPQEAPWSIECRFAQAMRCLASCAWAHNHCISRQVSDLDTYTSGGADSRLMKGLQGPIVSSCTHCPSHIASPRCVLCSSCLAVEV